MTNPHSLDRVRKYIDVWRTENGADAGEMRESILIRNGAYCGRKFNFGDYYAIWFVEEDELKISQADGQVVGRHRFGTAPAIRRAA